MPQLNSEENINNSFFDGQYKEIWRAVIPEDLTVKETEFLEKYFTLNPESRVLDLMCGYGRHALALSRKKIPVTAVDNLPGYINEVKRAAEEEHLPVTSVQADVMVYQPEGLFDLIICMGNSINFFNQTDTQKIISNVFAHLKPGGHFLINTWSLTEIVIKQFRDRYWNEIKGIKFLTESKYLFHPTRIETESIMIAPDGSIETKTGVDYIFSLSEMEAMLTNAGLVLEEVFSVPGKRRFMLGDGRAYLIARK